MKEKKILFLFGIILSLSVFIFAQEQKIQKCAVPNGIGGKYKLIVEAHTLDEAEKVISIDVVINPKNFTKEYMSEFAKRIKAEYCNEDIISLIIFDNKKLAMDAHHVYFSTGGKIDRRRGTYFLNRKTGEEAVEFSTKAGNPIDEVRIEFSKPTQDK